MTAFQIALIVIFIATFGAMLVVNNLFEDNMKASKNLFVSLAYATSIVLIIVVVNRYIF